MIDEKKTNREEDMSIQPQPISFSKGFIPPNIPIASFRQGDVDLNFILDTGSDKNVIDSSILENLQHTLIENSNVSILAGLGGAVEVQEYEIPFQHEDKEFTATFLAADLQKPMDIMYHGYAMKIHGMLGSLFLREHKMIMDFDNLIICSKKP